MTHVETKDDLGNRLQRRFGLRSVGSVAAKPKKKVAPGTPSGFHWPKINAASAGKPMPATEPLRNARQ